jgi:fluoroacetyl-CoA thioesterase
MASRNKILAIVYPCTFSHNQGQNLPVCGQPRHGRSAPNSRRPRSVISCEDLAFSPPLPPVQPAKSRTRMLDLYHIRPGLTGTAALIVGPEDTAPHVGSGRIAVLATPVMINLIEAAALAAVEELLPTGHQSLGIHLDVRHFAATPVGLRVTATAEVTSVEGRTITFRVQASDERELIGEGVHERVVVNVVRFDARVQRKLPNAP